MNDKELLALAAKAAGIEGTYVKNFNNYYYQGNTCGILAQTPEGNSYVWNPLTDDGAALRLAVKLGLWLTIDTEETMEVDVIKAVQGSCGERPKHHTQSFQSDPYAATRRAIVRAAAEIGMSMPKQPEPYDQQELLLCEVCGWKAIFPGEPCLMCERNEKEPK